MRLGALVPALVLGAALAAPSAVAADGHRSSERGRSGYHRSERGHGERYAPRSHQRYDRGRHDHGRRYDKPREYYGPRYRPYSRPYFRPQYRPQYRPQHRPQYRPYSRPYYRPYPYAPGYSYRPAPPVYYAPRPVPYGDYGGPVWGPPARGGVHGSVSVGVPFFGLSLYF